MYIGFVACTRTGLPQDLSEISFLAQRSPKNRLKCSLIPCYYYNSWANDGARGLGSLLFFQK